jgi:hypothetical protein
MANERAMLGRWILAHGVVLGASGCGVSSLVVAPTLPAPAATAPDPTASGRMSRSPSGAPDPMEAFAGRYGIRGTAKTDGCGGAIVLGARNITIASPHELDADVVNRRYEANATQGTVVAEGEFPASTCPGGRLRERWALARAGSSLEGVLVSEWPVKDDCENVCRVVFSIQATRVDQEDDE